MTVNIIFQEDIESVPLLDTKLFSAEALRSIQSYCKKCLKYACNRNKSKECGILIDSLNYKRYDKFKGQEGNVCITDSRMILQDEQNNKFYNKNRYIFIHNHPNNRGFSEVDIESFLDNEFIGCLIVVCNNGGVYLLRKLIGFSDTGIDSVWYLESGLTPMEFCKICSKYNIKFIHRRRVQDV